MEVRNQGILGRVTMAGGVIALSEIIAEAAISAAWEQFSTVENADEWLVHDRGRET
jgi:hypothetical protein